MQEPLTTEYTGSYELRKAHVAERKLVIRYMHAHNVHGHFLNYMIHHHRSDCGFKELRGVCR